MRYDSSLDDVDAEDDLGDFDIDEWWFNDDDDEYGDEVDDPIGSYDDQFGYTISGDDMYDVV